MRLGVGIVLAAIGALGVVSRAQGPAAMLTAPEQGQIATPDDVRLHYVVRGTGRPVVVLHGGPGLSSAYIAPDLAMLGDRYRLIAYDQRGAGRSTVVTDLARLTLEHHVGDVDVVRRHFCLDKVVLLGHSWGAVPAAFYARAHPSRVAAVILVDPMPARRVPWLDRFAANLRIWMDEPTAARVASLAAARRSASDPAAACRDYWGVFIRGYMADPNDLAMLGRMRGDVCDAPDQALANGSVVYRGAVGPLGDWDWRETFRGTDVPVLIVHGTKDPIPLASANEWQAAFPRARLVAIDDAGHFPYVEQPEAFRRAVDVFLESVRPPQE